MKPPDSLALSIFHYTADVKAGSLTEREPILLKISRGESELCNVGA
jgi:hypothetical protein